jgi:imidazolonepropionase-like amidohydrolase
MRSVKRASRHRIGSALLSALLPLASCGTQETAAPAGNATVFGGARIVVGDGTVIENGTFVVEGDRITLVGQTGAVTVPAGTPHVDLSGRTVMPALVNTHVHLGAARGELVDQLRHYAYYGVGTVQSLGLDSAALTREIRNEEIPDAARYLTSGRGITAPEPGRNESPYWVTTEGEARAAVQELAGQQVRLVKIWVDDRNGEYEKLSPTLYGAVIDEAHRNEQKVAAHIFALDDAKGLLRAGVDAFAHGVRDTDIDEEGLSLFREHSNVVLIPNLPDRGVATDLNWLSGTVPATELQEMQANATDRPEVQQRFAVQGRNLAQLNQAGTRIAMGTDGSVPWAAHLEMEDMAAAGMTPAQVIVAATRNGADLLRLSDVGAIQPGMVADFIVLDANPIDDITNTRRISAVYLRGTEVDRSAISARLTGAAGS